MAGKKKNSQVVRLNARQEKTLKALVDFRERQAVEYRATEQRLSIYLQNTRDTHDVPADFVTAEIKDGTVVFSKPGDKEPKDDA